MRNVLKTFGSPTLYLFQVTDVIFLHRFQVAYIYTYLYLLFYIIYHIILPIYLHKYIQYIEAYTKI